jgi:cyclin-dependent kinase regulatory subunit CKS1
MARSLPDRLLTEQEWRHLGVQQSRGWVHYAIHKYAIQTVPSVYDLWSCSPFFAYCTCSRPEPHILLFRRPLGTDPATGRVNPVLEKEAKDKYEQDFQ